MDWKEKFWKIVKKDESESSKTLEQQPRKQNVMLILDAAAKEPKPVQPTSIDLQSPAWVTVTGNRALHAPNSTAPAHHVEFDISQTSLS